jgi:CheY-like chemotaxis protein
VRRLRADERTKGKPIIVLTARVFEPDQVRAHAAGCDIFLPKPCLPDTLVDEIRRMLAVRSRPVRTRPSGDKEQIA